MEQQPKKLNFTADYIQKGAIKTPRKTVIYGTPKMGKSTLASAAKNTLVIPTEDRLSHIHADKTPVVSEMEHIYDVLEYLENGEHSYKHLSIDTIDAMEPMLHNYLCKKNNWKSITDDHDKETAFYKGLKFHAPAAWREFLNRLDKLRLKKDISIILVAHEGKMKIDPPDSEPYTCFIPSINEYSVHVLQEWADTIGFYQRETFVSKTDGSKTGKAIGNNKRVLHLGGDSPAFISGNSYGLEDSIEVSVEYVGQIMEYILGVDK